MVKFLRKRVPSTICASWEIFFLSIAVFSLIGITSLQAQQQEKYQFDSSWGGGQASEGQPSDLPDAPGIPAADRVLGQLDFTHNAPNTVDAESMNDGRHLAVDKSVTPNRLYVADRGNSRVLGYSSVAAFVNRAPANLVIGQPDFFSSACNTGGVSPNSLCFPEGVAVDSAGNLYVADFSNNRVLEYTSPFAACSSFPCVGAGANVVFGQGDDFFANGCNNSGTQPTSDSLCSPVGVALDSANALFVADSGNNRVLKYNTPLTPPSNTTANFVFGQGGVFTTGIPNKGGLNRNSLSGPAGLVLDSVGNLYVADNGNNRVLEYNAPLTATANNIFGQPTPFLNGCNQGGLSANSLCNPHGVALDSAGNLYVVDSSNSRVLEYDTPPANTTANFVFGQGGVFTTNTCNQGGLSANSLCLPLGVGVVIGGAQSGNVYIVDRSNNRVLQYDTPLITGLTTASVVLGQFDFTHNSPNSVDAGAFSAPSGVAVDKSGVPPNRLYVADSNNHRVLGYLNAATFLSGAPADLVIGQPDFFVGLCNNGGLNASGLCTPKGVAVDAAGNLFVADQSNHRVLQYTNPFAACGGLFPCVGAGADVVFGQGGVFTTGGCNQGGLSADSLCNPQGVAVDAAGNVFIADFSNHRVLAFTGATTATVVFGQGGVFTTQLCNQGGLSPISLCNPAGVALDSAGNLYVADQSNSRVLEYNTPLTNTEANNVFGQGGIFSSNTCNNGGVSANSLCFPFGVALDSGNKLFVADSSTNRVLEYNTPLTNTTANFVFGQNRNFTSSGCNLFATRPSRRTLCTNSGVSGVAVDAAGNVFIADFNNNRVLEYDIPIP